ncbi:snoRNA-binding rRNA-processing protein [Martiniozyma asiatica (nom. inval.)]|nr:snoRNA-binding rRNA-processing protein [Martiniozyma asiatica]
MKSDFKFSNLLGTVYREGNLLFTPDGTTLLSPVGNRVTSFDLINNTSFTFSYSHRKNITSIALNPQSTLLLTIDEDGRAILVNYRARTVLHHFNFKNKIACLKFSPSGEYFAVAVGRFIEIWKTPDGDERQFAPFVRFRVYAGHSDDITDINWSADGRFLLSSSTDLTARVWSLHSEDNSVKMSLAGHRERVVSAFFDKSQEMIYTVSKDGALFRWEYSERPGEEELPQEQKTMSWRIHEKNFFMQGGVKCVEFHAESGLCVVGFKSGEFRLYELPGFTMVQQLSMGKNAISSVVVNKTGEWVAFGSELGQLLVYEWQSESYILRQQGHFDSMNSLAYSPDGSRIVTASDDGKIKIWDVTSGFCLATFEEHQSAVTSVAFAKKGQVLFSASLDGTVRAWDLIRFRCFRTFTGLERLQWTSVAVDQGGEVVCAGSLDSFEIHVWSVQTAQLLDRLSGHEGPISYLSFGKEEGAKLASASWDKTIRVWDIFGRQQSSEPFDLTSEALSLSMRPDSKEVAVSSLDGKISFFSIEEGKMIREIDGRKDIVQGRHKEDVFTAKNSRRGKHFTTISYSFDGLSILAGGNNNTICLYDLPNEVLLKRFIVSQNMSLNGTLEFLNSKNIENGVAKDLVDASGELSDAEDRARAEMALPGSQRGDIGLRSTRAEVRVTSLSFSPTANAFAAASTEGLLIYSVDEIQFDPFDLDIDITPANTILTLEEGEYLTALVMAFRLNERYLVHKVFEAVPYKDITLVVRDLPAIYVQKLIEFMGTLGETQHVEFATKWVEEVLTIHSVHMVKHGGYGKGLRGIGRFLGRGIKDVVNIGRKSNYLVEFLNKGVVPVVDKATSEDIVIEEVIMEEEASENKNHNGGDDEDEDAQDNDASDSNDDDDNDDDDGWFGPDDKKKYTDNFSGSSDDDSDVEMEG